MTRRTQGAFALSLAVSAALWLGLQSVLYAQGATRGAPDRRFVPTEIQGCIANPAALPPGLDLDALVTVVATLAGEPVALAQETASRRLSRAEKGSRQGAAAVLMIEFTN